MQRRGKDLRVGDSEREHAMSQLGAHMSAGRLDIAEYDQRCARVAAARFASEIARVFDDLPTPSPRPSAAPGRNSRPSGVALLWLLGAGGLLLVVVTKQIWMLALLAVLAVVLWAGRHRGSR